MVGGGEPSARGIDHLAGQVASRAKPHDLRPGYQRPGAQLGPGQIHRHQAGAAGLARSRPDVAGHRPPRRRIIVGAVDPRDAHPGSHQTGHQIGIAGGLGGQCHHDPGQAVRGGGTEQSLRVAGQQSGARVEVHRGSPRRAPAPAFHRGDRRRDQLEAGLDMSLAAAQR